MMFFVRPYVCAAVLVTAMTTAYAEEPDYNRSSPAMVCSSDMVGYEGVAKDHRLLRRDLTDEDAQKFVKKLNETGSEKTAFTADVVTFFYDKQIAVVIFQRVGEACLFKVAMTSDEINAMLEDAGVPQRLDRLKPVDSEGI